MQSTVAKSTQKIAALATEAKKAASAGSSVLTFKRNAAPKLSRKRMATRARLMKAATELFAQQGVSSTSLEEICERAGFTRGALYSNFSDKTDLLVCVIKDEYKKLFDYLESKVEASINSGSNQTIESVVKDIVSSLPLDRNFVMLQQQIVLLALRSPELAAVTIPLSDQFTETVGQFVTDSLARIGRHATVDNQELGELIFMLAERRLRRFIIDNPDSQELPVEALGNLEKWLPILLKTVSVSE